MTSVGFHPQKLTMTVSSLWKVLDDAGCGTSVGIREVLKLRPDLKDHHAKVVKPWNVNEIRKDQVANANTPSSDMVALAVDLSIWICESLTSRGASDNHVNPALHLVFTRTVRLLSYGIKLIFVVEGKRRIRAVNGKQEKLQKRRSGTDFWRACRDCKEMLESLGVPVVQAKAEGEALCALLNQRGIVDGVISNDGDCLVFGARILYTRFSIENLDQSKVIRYDSDKLAAHIKSTDAEDVSPEEVGKLSLSRSDLVSFAILTGSDLAGSGFPNVGYFKAIRFIRKSKLDNPFRTENASIDELVSWERAARFICNEHEVQREDDQAKKVSTCCSRCCHQGDKRSYEKYGCKECGTEPGEPCWVFGKEDRFRKNLRAKALMLEPKFEPSQVIESYMRPNDDQIPYNLVDFTARSLVMRPPNLEQLMATRLVIKGRCLHGSRDYVMQVTGRLLSRLEITRIRQGEGVQRDPAQGAPIRFSRSQPVPFQIIKTKTKGQVPFYEVKWKVRATLTDDEGDGLDGYEYSTLEQQETMKTHFPKLVEDFVEAEKERHKQGDNQQENRRLFLRSLSIDVDAPIEKEITHETKSPGMRKKATAKKRETFFKARVTRPTLRLRRAKKAKTGKEAGFLFRCTSREGPGRNQPRLVPNQQKIPNQNRHDANKMLKSTSSIESDRGDPFLKNEDHANKAKYACNLACATAGSQDGVPKIILVPTSVEDGLVEPKQRVRSSRSESRENVLTPWFDTQNIESSYQDSVVSAPKHPRNEKTSKPNPEEPRLRATSPGDSLLPGQSLPSPPKGNSVLVVSNNLSDPVSLSSVKAKTFWSIGGMFVAMSPIKSSRCQEPPGLRLSC